MTRQARRGWLVLALVMARGVIGAAPRRAEPPSEPPHVARARFLMGTRLEIILPAAAPEAAFEAAFSEVERLETILSNWRDESEISRLNQSPAGVPFRCSAELFAALRVALRFARDTEGAFDPTVEPLVRALGLRSPEGRLPTISGIPGLARGTPDPHGPEDAPIGWWHVHLDRSRRSACFDAPGVGVDLGGIGKGIGLDAAARVLVRHGVRTALLDFGGQVLAVGAPRGSAGWAVSVSGPGDRQHAVASITLRNLSASTSGNDERSVPGKSGQVGHILDPSRKSPAPFGGTVTVVSREAAAADALSTGLFVMGPERGGAWAEASGLAALFLWRGPDGTLERKATTAFLAIEDDGENGAGERMAPDHR
jgi:thiamine biosynthesis lipoprotein